MKTLPIGTEIYFFSERDNAYLVGRIYRIAIRYEYYVLDGCMSLDALTHYHNVTTYVKAVDAFVTLDDAKKYHMIQRLKGED